MVWRLNNFNKLMLVAAALLIAPTIISPTTNQLQAKKATKMITKPITVKEIQTDNNYTVWFAPSNVKVVTIKFTFLNSGKARNNAKDKNSSRKNLGVTDVLQEMLKEGAGEYDSEQFKKFLQEKNIQLCIEADNDTTSILARTVSSNFKDAFKILALVATKPKFDPKELELAKIQTKAALSQQLQEPRFIAGQELVSFVLGEDHVYSARTEDVVKNIPNITREQLVEFVKSHFTRENIRIAIAGNANEDEIAKIADEVLKDLPSVPVELAEQKAPEEYHNLGKTHYVFMDVPQSNIYFAQKGVAFEDPDFAAFTLIQHMLGAPFESRLWHEVREKRGLAYFCSTKISNADKANLLLGLTATDQKNVAETIKTIKSVWETITKDGITQAELDLFKSNYTGVFASNFDSTIGVAGVLSAYQKRRQGLERLEKRNDMISNLTLDDINKALKRLHPDGIAFVVVGRDKNELKENSKAKL